MRKKNPEETKELLLQAAAAVVLERGTNITLEQVASTAKVSKGGLLHHFPNKESLLRGLLQDLIGAFERSIETGLEPQTSKGRFARAYIRTSFEVSPEEQALTHALAGIVVGHPELAKDVEAAFAFCEQRLLEDGLSESSAMIIRLTCDGLWFGELSGMISLPQALRDQVRDQLLEMTR
jgi:AcrR family transcriptional regulator